MKQYRIQSKGIGKSQHTNPIQSNPSQEEEKNHTRTKKKADIHSREQFSVYFVFVFHLF